MKNFKEKTLNVLKNRKGAFSIEMLIIVGIIVVLVVVAMGAFSSQSANVTDQFGSKVSQGAGAQDALNNLLLSQQITSTDLNFGK